VGAGHSGSAFARELERIECHVITVDKSAGAGVEMDLCDINSVHVVRSLLDVIKEQFYSPHINALINSAGVHPTNSLTPMSELQGNLRSALEYLY
jgi:short-subunit dehydrogenase involved in D-alanine esterification of teichoic acids